MTRELYPSDFVDAPFVVGDLAGHVYTGLQNSLWNNYLANGIRPQGEGPISNYLQSRYDAYSNTLKDAVNYQNSRMAGTALPNEGNDLYNRMLKARRSNLISKAAPAYGMIHQNPLSMGVNKFLSGSGGIVPYGTRAAAGTLSKVAPALRIGSNILGWGMSPVGMTMVGAANAPDNTEQYIWNRASQESGLEPLHGQTSYIGLNDPSKTYEQLYFEPYESSLDELYGLQKDDPEKFARESAVLTDNPALEYAVRGRDTNEFGPEVYDNWINHDTKNEYDARVNQMHMTDEEGNDQDVASLTELGFKPNYSDYQKGDNAYMNVMNAINNFIFDNGLLSRYKLGDAQWSPSIAIPFDAVASKVYADLDNTMDDDDAQQLGNAVNSIAEWRERNGY